MIWRKSSFSDPTEHGDCVEVAWRKSSFSNPTEHGDCIEVAWPDPQVAVRDSKYPSGPALTFPRATWTALTESVRA